MLNIDKGDQLEELIKKTFSTIEDIADVRQMTIPSRQVIQKIEVDKDGNVDILPAFAGGFRLGRNRSN